MDDQVQGDGSPLEPIPISDDEEEAPDELLESRSASSASESPVDMDQDDDDDAPAESAGPESASPERESSLFVDQPGPTITPEADDAESSQSDEDDEEEVQAESKQPEGTRSPENEPARGQREDAGGNRNGEMEYSDNSSDDAEPCTRPCQKQAKAAARKLEVSRKRIVAKDQTIADLRRQLQAAKSDIRRLRQQLRAYTGSDSPDEEPDWQNMLRECSSPSGGNYERAWKTSYRALNMPIDLNKVHPQVRFIAKDDDEHSSSRQSSPNDSVSVRSDEDEEFRLTKPLPDNILYQILTELLTKDGLIHCFSRLDPFCQPDEFPSRQDVGGSSTGLRGRFFISKEERSYLSLTHDTEDPKILLAVLCASRKTCWFGIHIFYSSNTFAFSSLGEMDRFATGYGTARWSRIQNIELAWVGGKCVSFNLGNGKRLNRRTLALAWMAEASSIKTLCIHISESAKNVIRRRHEPNSHKLYMKGKTAGQPNHRMTRSMRACTGMDYLYQLRGLLWFRAYDLDKEIVNPERSLAKIRDRSFVIDMERQITQEKVPARREKSKLENLDPLFPVGASWTPSRRDFDRIRELYTEDTGFDNRCNDLDYDATSSDGTIESDAPDEDGDGSDDDEDDDSSGPSIHSPPGPSRRRRPFTPAPSPGVAEEGEFSESEGDLPDESQHSVSDDLDQSDLGNSARDSDEDDADSVTTEVFRRHRLNQYLRDDSQVSSGQDNENLKNLRRTRSEGGSISHVSSEITRARQPVIVLEDEDDATEIQSTTPARSSTRLPSRLSLFVTPAPGEPRTSGTPGRRSTSALQARRASSAPHVDASSPRISSSYIDLTGIDDSDEEAENGHENVNVASGTGEEEEGSVQAGDDTTNGAIEAADGVPALLGTKRVRLTSPASEGGGDSKRQRSNEVRTGSLPLTFPAQTWSFPRGI